MTENLSKHASTGDTDSKYINSNSNENYFSHYSNNDKPLVIRHHIPGEPPSKPRMFNNGKDITLSLVPLVIFCILVAWLSGNLGMQFGPGRRTDSTFAYQADLAVTAAAHEFGIPLRFPQLPTSWKPNSGSKASIDNTIVQNLGWVTNDGYFIQISQTIASTASLIIYLAEKKHITAEQSPLSGWQWYIRDDNRVIAVKRYTDITIALSGNAHLVSYQIAAATLDRSTAIH